MQEFRDDPALGEHFGWVDADNDDFIETQEWNAAQALGMGEYGAVRWRFMRNLPYIPAPLVYQDVYYMVRSGGIITSLNPATGELLKEGRSREGLGVYYASPVAADGKVYLASEEGKITVLNAAAKWEVLAVNDLGEEVHATPALSESRIYVRTRSSLYCFGTSR